MEKPWHFKPAAAEAQRGSGNPALGEEPVNVDVVQYTAVQALAERSLPISFARGIAAIAAMI
jgi:hypothetical protein